jgi:hypothetical protein
MIRAALLGLALAIAGCGQGGASPAPSVSAPASAPPSVSASAPAPAVSARRPTRRYFLARTSVRCEIYAADVDETTPAFQTPCPPDLIAGERIRIAGKACFRESPDPLRRKPVVCPDPLTNFETRERPSAK